MIKKLIAISLITFFNGVISFGICSTSYPPISFPENYTNPLSEELGDFPNPFGKKIVRTYSYDSKEMMNMFVTERDPTNGNITKVTPGYGEPGNITTFPEALINDQLKNWFRSYIYTAFPQIDGLIYNSVSYDCSSPVEAAKGVIFTAIIIDRVNQPLSNLVNK